ncbi:MAG: single-stranded DNA-binding protein [Bacteroidia bacterium]
MNAPSLILAESGPLRPPEAEVQHVNLVQLLGVLQKDPEILDHHRGKMARLYLITSEAFRDEYGELTNNVQSHILTALGSWAIMAGTHLIKGNVLYVEGRLVHNSFCDRLGVRRILTEVKLHKLKIIR